MTSNLSPIMQKPNIHENDGQRTVIIDFAKFLRFWHQICHCVEKKFVKFQVLHVFVVGVE